MKDQGLIIGIEYDKSVIQACVYDMRAGIPVACDEVSGLSIADAIRRILGRYNVDEIGSLCVKSGLSDIEELNDISNQINSLGINENQYMITGPIQSFAYYAYSQQKELYKSGVVLMDYDGQIINIYRLSYNTADCVQYIVSAHEQYTIDSQSGMSDKKLVEYVSDYFSRNTASSVYLTGKGFDVKKLPDGLSKVLVNGRKAYIGQNLYVRGACYAAYENIYHDIFDNVTLLVDGCIKVNIETDINERGKAMRFRIIKMGTEWYMARRSVDFIIEDMTTLALKLITADGKCTDKIIDISSIPYREGKTTRIRMDIYAVSQDKCILTIKDLGFGEMFRTSGRVITEEIDLSEACL